MLFLWSGGNYSIHYKCSRVQIILYRHSICMKICIADVRVLIYEDYVNCTMDILRAKSRFSPHCVT
jgi:hypothetical protein